MNELQAKKVDIVEYSQQLIAYKLPFKFLVTQPSPNQFILTGNMVNTGQRCVMHASHQDVHMLSIQLRKVLLQFVSDILRSADARILSMCHLHLSGQIAVGIPQIIHLYQLRIPRTHQLFIFVCVLVEHERCDVHRHSILDVLVYVVYRCLRAIVAIDDPALVQVSKSYHALKKQLTW